MSHILAPDDPSTETDRLLGQARHCRDLATAMDEAQWVLQLVCLAKSYEAKAALVRASARTAF